LFVRCLCQWTTGDPADDVGSTSSSRPMVSPRSTVVLVPLFVKNSFTNSPATPYCSITLVVHRFEFFRACDVTPRLSPLVSIDPRYPPFVNLNWCSPGCPCPVFSRQEVSHFARGTGKARPFFFGLLCGPPGGRSPSPPSPVVLSHALP